MADFSPESLLEIWKIAPDRLTPQEIESIRHLIPAEQFALSGRAPLPAKLTNYYKKIYADYCELYALEKKNGDRTIKRWVSEGRACDPPALPPLDEPRKMAAWWRRLKGNRKPPAIMLDYERDASLLPEEYRTADEKSAAANTGASSQENKTVINPENVITAIDLGAMDLTEGEALRQARALAKANYDRVAAASAAGDGAQYSRWIDPWKESVVVLSRLEKQNLATLKALGELISRTDTLAELAQLIETLRVMHEMMPGRILDELAKSDSRRHRRIHRLLLPALTAAVHKVREGELALLRHVESLTPDAAADPAALAA